LFSNAIRFHDLTCSEFKIELCCQKLPFLVQWFPISTSRWRSNGSSLGPLFANISLTFHETTWLNNCPTKFKHLLYCRYVDDTFLLFHSRQARIQTDATDASASVKIFTRTRIVNIFKYI
jgi:hypothetical protein